MTTDFVLLGSGVAMAAVSERTLVQRINRRLALQGERLHVARREDPNTGRYYITDDRNTLIAWHCDPEQLASELGVLAELESMAN